MQHHLGFVAVLLAIAAPVLGTPISQDYSGKRPSSLPTCGVRLFIGQNLGKSGPTDCYIDSYNNAQSDNTVNATVIVNNTACTDFGTPHTLISEKTWDFSNSSVGPFAITESGSTCSNVGENCSPVLEVGGADFEMNYNAACREYHDPTKGVTGFWWDCAVACVAPPPVGPKCDAPTKSATFQANGTSQRVSDISDCNKATACTISAAKASAYANSLTNTKDVTETNSVGVTTTVTAGAEFLGEGGSVSVGVSTDYSKAIANSAGVTNTTTTTTTTTYSYTQAPNTSGYLAWLPLLNCQNITMTCDGAEFDLKSCTQATLSDGTTPDGTYVLTASS